MDVCSTWFQHGIPVSVCDVQWFDFCGFMAVVCTVYMVLISYSGFTSMHCNKQQWFPPSNVVSMHKSLICLIMRTVLPQSTAQLSFNREQSSTNGSRCTVCSSVVVCPSHRRRALDAARCIISPLRHITSLPLQSTEPCNAGSIALLLLLLQRSSLRDQSLFLAALLCSAKQLHLCLLITYWA